MPIEFEEIHAEHLAVAVQISDQLAEALAIVGPVRLKERKDMGLAHTLSRSIVGQQLSTKAASSIWGRLEAASISANETIPEYFTDRNSESMRSCGLSGNKVRALLGIRKALLYPKMSTDRLIGMSHRDRSQLLLEIWGVGQWTCDMASIFHYGCADVWPEGDVTVQKTFQNLIGRRKPGHNAKKFAPYRSYLAVSLWQFADRVPET